MNEREKYCKKRAREIYKTFICMDNTYGKHEPSINLVARYPAIKHITMAAVHHG